jgi:hypothetical protein
VAELSFHEQLLQELEAEKTLVAPESEFLKQGVYSQRICEVPKKKLSRKAKRRLKIRQQL